MGFKNSGREQKAGKRGDAPCHSTLGGVFSPRGKTDHCGSNDSGRIASFLGRELHRSVPLRRLRWFYNECYNALSQMFIFSDFNTFWKKLNMTLDKTRPFQPAAAAGSFRRAAAALHLTQPA